MTPTTSLEISDTKAFAPDTKTTKAQVVSGENQENSQMPDRQLPRRVASSKVVGQINLRYCPLQPNDNPPQESTEV